MRHDKMDPKHRRKFFTKACNLYCSFIYVATHVITHVSNPIKTTKNTKKNGY